MTLDPILEPNEREETVAKSAQGPAEDRRRRRIWGHFFKTLNISAPLHLDDSHIPKFIRLRRHGDLQVPGVNLTKPAPKARTGENRPSVVTPRTIDADLVYLNRVLNWATRRREEGVPILKERPVSIPRLRNPNAQRPMATWDDARALLRHADSVDPQKLFGCYLRLLDGLGWRVTGVCHVQAADVDLTPGPFSPYGRMRMDEWVDKEEHGGWIPISRHVAATLKRLLKRRGLKVGRAGYLFPEPRAKGKPWTRWRVWDLTNDAEKVAGIEDIGGAHAFRRKWFSERKDHPIADLMAAGGHANSRMVELYQQAEPGTTYRVVSQPTRRIRKGI